MYALCNAGAKINAYDPVAVETAQRITPEGVAFMDSPLDALKGARAAIVATEWQEIINLPWEEAASIMAPPRFIFDGRNSLNMNRLTSLGFHYRGVGRTQSNGTVSDD